MPQCVESPALPQLADNHARLAMEGHAPAEARDLLSIGTTTDPTRATTIDERTLCLLSAPSYWFNQHWNYYKQACPDGTLCGSASNDHSQVVSGNFYIVALSSSKTALQTCNGGSPLGTDTSDTLSAQLQSYVASSGWHTFYTSSPYSTSKGVAFTYYGFAINRFRMRIYNANSDTRSLAAAIW